MATPKGKVIAPTAKPAPSAAAPRPPRPPKMRLRTIRRSATVAPFGVGAIYDFGDESLVALDIYHWKNKGDRIRLPRLERELGVDYFQMAPRMPERYNPHAARVPFKRFPQWLFCPSCRGMIRWAEAREQPGEHPRCGCQKHSKLVPMRFVVACANGHLADVPWVRWAHSNAKKPAQQQCENTDLRFETRRGTGGGLNSLLITCRTCNASRSLAGIARKDSLRGVIAATGSCDNRQPWERWETAAERQPCTAFPQVLQRGASNLYFPLVASAIDIPEGVERQDELTAENIRNHALFPFMIQVASSNTLPPRQNPAVIPAIRMIAEQLTCSEEDVIAVLDRELNPPVEITTAKGPEGLLREEWNAFLFSDPTEDTKAPFVTQRVDLSTWFSALDRAHPSHALASSIRAVVLAKRLREVRALTGFERIEPGSSVTRPDLDKKLAWRPAVEVFGEGVFIALSEQAISDWEAKTRTVLEQRLGAMRLRRQDSNLSFLPRFSPRFVLLHSLAHLLIRQLSFECGYASSSLRERIYSAEAGPEGEPMSGVLIYTADGDSEGSLGGLVREGQPERLLPTLLAALRAGRWCSADPICRELPAQGLQGLNRAACHGCALVSETSCVCANVMLDRAVLVGDGSFLKGYFDATCTAMDAAMGSSSGGAL